MRSRIVTTRPDGGVAITTPSPLCIRHMCMGGRWGVVTRGYTDEQIERQTAAGHDRSAVIKFVHALAFGGCTTAEALAIVRDRDCGRIGTAHELWDVDDVPRDRWFRNAWVRGHNGGPIWVSLEKARPIQFSMIEAAVTHENKRRSSWTERLFRNAQPLIEVDWYGLHKRIMAADTPEELRTVWPVELQT